MARHVRLGMAGLAGWVRCVPAMWVLLGLGRRGLAWKVVARQGVAGKASCVDAWIGALRTVC